MALILNAAAPGARAEGPKASDDIAGLLASVKAAGGDSVAISLTEAVRTAVANNPGLRALSHIPRAARQDIAGAVAAYEPTLLVDLGVGEDSFASHNSLSGNDVVEKTRRWGDVTVSKLTRSGATVDLSWTNSRSSSNSSFQGLVPQYDPGLGISLEQPLLQDLGGRLTRTTIELARNSSAGAMATFESELSAFVYTVITAYWDHARAGAALDVERRSFALANELVKQNQAKVDVGLLAPVVVREARAEAAQREEKVLAAEHTLDMAARTLQYTVMFGIDSGGPRAVRPGQRHLPEPATLDLEASLRTAAERRAEVRAAQIAVDSAQLSERQSRMERLPELALVGSYKLAGLAGNAVPLTSIYTGETVTSAFGGSYGDALDLMTESDHYSYTVGLTFEVPLSGAAPRAAHARAEAELAYARERLRAVLSGVVLEVERAAGGLASAYQRVAAARLARQLGEENLANQRKRYEVGMVTTTDVLDFQEKLARALAAEVEAVSDHAGAIAALSLSEGRLLEQYGVTVEVEGDPGLPWWAKF